MSDSRPRILYIEDTPDARLLISRLLSADYEVSVADDGLIGIEQARAAPPDLVLLDINLPHFSGHEVATRLRDLLPDTPIVALTADVTPGSREKALAAGCDGYLTKPINVDTIQDDIAAYLHGRRDTLDDAETHRAAHLARTVARLEDKVRELTRADEQNQYLLEQNQRAIIMLRRRQRMLEAGARVARAITSVLDLDELLHSTVTIICEEFDLQFSGIYLLTPDGDWATLTAGHSASDATAPGEGQQVAMDDDTAIGRAVGKRRAQVVQASEQAAGRAEMALPLIVQETVLGVLSVHSSEAGGVQHDDVAALQSMADQVAIAIANARLLREFEAANAELVRTKTFEAIATATGEALHWVGNKAAPIPGSADRARQDLLSLLAMAHTLIAESDAGRTQHPFYSVFLDTLAVAQGHGIDLPALARDLAAMSPERLMAMGDLESILEDLQIVRQSATRILDIKEDLIGPARLQKIDVFDLPSLILETVGDMGLPADTVHYDFAPDLPLVQADPRQLGRVFTNLVKNAWEAMQEQDAPPRIDIRVMPAVEPGFVLTEVCDNGPGIPPEIIDKIWVSFFSTKGSRGGTGLGLSAVMEIMNQTGGRIRVVSDVGRGSTFQLQIPTAAR